MVSCAFGRCWEASTLGGSAITRRNSVLLERRAFRVPDQQCTRTKQYGYPTVSSANLMTRASNGRHQLWLLVMSLGVCRPAAGHSADSTLPPSAPPFKQLRYDENYMYLRDTSRHSDYLDSIKFIPLNTNGDWYLTLGGEIRERYEYYHNNLWGRGPQDDDGYWLQRYMVHAD